MINLLLLAGLAVSVVAYLLPSARATALKVVGIPTNTATKLVSSSITAVFVFLTASLLFGTLIGLVVGVCTVAVANRNDHVEVFDLPPPSATLRHKVAARQTPVGGTAGPINTPGSVAALAIDARRTAGPGNETAARRGSPACTESCVPARQ